MKRAYVVMGVTGTGKTTVARALAHRIGAAFIEGDDLHSDANRGKMAAGIPLTDADRLPWLGSVAASIRDSDANVVATCSALRRCYRDLIRAEAGCPVVFVHLDGDASVIADRLARRHGHFMPPSLLESQLETLEPPGSDEPHVTVGISRDTAALVDEVCHALGRS